MSNVILLPTGLTLQAEFKSIQSDLKELQKSLLEHTNSLQKLAKSMRSNDFDKLHRPSGKKLSKWSNY